MARSRRPVASSAATADRFSWLQDMRTPGAICSSRAASAGAIRKAPASRADRLNTRVERDGSNTERGSKPGPQFVERLPHGRHQGFGHGGRLHAAAVANEQRILEMGAQAGQRIAHRRLGNPQDFAGPCQAPLVIDGFQYRQEVQVD